MKTDKYRRPELYRERNMNFSLQKYRIVKLQLLYLMLFCMCLVPSGVTGAQAKIAELNLNGALLKNVAFTISKETGYQIIINKDWAETTVSGSYRDVEIEQFFRRVLKGKNISIISNETEKKIVVRLFGDKRSDNLIVISGVQHRKWENLPDDAVDPLDGQKIAEIRRIQAEYEAQRERWMNDPDAVDPMDGQRISEIRMLQAKNDEAMAHWKNDPEAVDSMDGQKISEIRAIQAKNDAAIERWKDDPEAIDSMDGQKISVIRIIQAKNDTEMEKWRNDPNAVDPVDGQRMLEIRAIQAKYDAAK